VIGDDDSDSNTEGYILFMPTSLKQEDIRVSKTIATEALMTIFFIL